MAIISEIRRMDPSSIVLDSFKNICAEFDSDVKLAVDESRFTLYQDRQTGELYPDYSKKLHEIPFVFRGSRAEVDWSQLKSDPIKVGNVSVLLGFQEVLSSCIKKKKKKPFVMVKDLLSITDQKVDQAFKTLREWNVKNHPADQICGLTAKVTIPEHIGNAVEAFSTAPLQKGEILVMQSPWTSRFEYVKVIKLYSNETKIRSQDFIEELCEYKLPRQYLDAKVISRLF